MARRYTLSECYIVLDVDPKTFRSWLQKAGIEPQVSKADPRVKYLTEDQVRSLASDHERDPDRPRRSQEAIPPNAYKTLQDQVKELENLLGELGQRQSGVYEELLESIATLETRQWQVSEDLKAETISQVDALRLLVDQGHQQQESLVERFTQQAVQVDQVREVYTALEGLNKEVAADVATMTERLDREEIRVEQFTTQLDAVKIIALDAQRRVDAQDQVIAELRVQLQDEVQAREMLAEQVAVLCGEKKGSEKQPFRF